MKHYQRYVMISWYVLMRISVQYFYIAHLGVQYETHPAHLPFNLRCQSGICISYNTGTNALPDIYARHPRALSARGRVHIYQAKHECLCYNQLHPGTLKICPNLKENAQLAYIVPDADYDSGKLF